MKKLMLIATLALLLPSLASAQQTQTSVQNAINTNITTNGQNQITGVKLNSVLTAMNGAIFQPFGYPNTWQAKQNFNGNITANGGLGTGGVMDMADTGGLGATVTPFTFATTSENYSFPDVDTHYTFQILSVKTGTGTGSRTVLVANQTCEGMDATGYCVGIQGTGIALASSGGNYVGMNAVSQIPTGLTGINSSYGLEADNIIGSPVGVKNGVRIADEGTSAGTGTVISAAIEITKMSTAGGYNDGLLFAEEGRGNTNFPVVAGGTLIRAEANTVALNAGIDLSASTGGFTEAAIVLPPAGTEGSNAIYFGASGVGGAIISGTGAGGGAVNFGNGTTYFSWGNTFPWAVTSSGNVTQNGTLNIGGIPSSAGSGGLYVCIDSAGNTYKKSSCP